MTGDGVNERPGPQRRYRRGHGINGNGPWPKRPRTWSSTTTTSPPSSWPSSAAAGSTTNIKKYLTYLLRCNITEVIVIGGAVPGPRAD